MVELSQGRRMSGKVFEKPKVADPNCYAEEWWNYFDSSQQRTRYQWRKLYLFYLATRLIWGCKICFLVSGYS